MVKQMVMTFNICHLEMPVSLTRCSQVSTFAMMVETCYFTSMSDLSKGEEVKGNNLALTTLYSLESQFPNEIQG
ncbi:hypothetical protein V6N11_043360 [Hibiscus sabdariffa]|uniref:Uncharacterized protein n=1 Tax=Hibiscus sabdariffa TaxID=183260 RepID=A0ABR2ABU4_9ROSI